MTKLLLKNCIFFNGIFSKLQNLILVNIGFLLWKMTGLSSRSCKGHQKTNLSTVAWDISKKVAKHGGLVWIAWFWQFFVIISSYGTQIFFWWPFRDCQLKPVILHIRNPIFTTIWFLSFEKIPLKKYSFSKVIWSMYRVNLKLETSGFLHLPPNMVGVGGLHPDIQHAKYLQQDYN